MSTFTRRRFIKQSAQGATALLASTAFITSAEDAKHKSPNNRITLALIGAGGRGTSLATGLSGTGDVQFKYVCDVNDSRGVDLMRDLQKRQGHPIKRIVDMRVALDDKEIDAVVIATPEHWHALATVWACQAGKDVYVEKTASLKLWEGR